MAPLVEIQGFVGPEELGPNRIEKRKKQGEAEEEEEEEGEAAGTGAPRRALWHCCSMLRWCCTHVVVVLQEARL
jgi:hypothetical protein